MYLLLFFFKFQSWWLYLSYVRSSMVLYPSWCCSWRL